MSEPMEARRVAAARAGDESEFRRLTEPHRRELLVHCYRIVGSIEDAEDLLQESLLRAWRRLDSFEGRSTFRAWLYRIATYASIDLIDRRPSRTLPTETHPPARAGDPFLPPPSDSSWLTPYPDGLLDDAPAGQEARYTARESVALAFLVALQVLPPRQRAVLLLRDVVGCHATEVAALLEITVSSVNSLLHRARATLEARLSSSPRPPDETVRKLLVRYVETWESGDVNALVALLKEDATMVMPPTPSWFRGRESIRDLILATILAAPSSAVRLVPVAANGQPAFAFYRRSGVAAPFTLFGIHLITLEGARIASLTTFTDPSLADRFEIPQTLI